MARGQPAVFSRNKKSQAGELGITRILAWNLESWSLLFLKGIAIEELAEHFLLAGAVFRNNPADPCRVDEMLRRDVFAGGVATPGPATDAGCERHAVVEIRAVAPDLRLSNYNAAYRGHHRQSMDVIFIKGINAGRMALAADLIYLLHHSQGVFESAAVLEDCQNRGHFLTAEAMFFPDFVFLDNDESTAAHPIDWHSSSTIA